MTIATAKFSQKHLTCHRSIAKFLLAQAGTALDMPIQGDTVAPRASVKHTALLQLEKYRLALASTKTNTSIYALVQLAFALHKAGDIDRLKRVAHAIELLQGLVKVKVLICSVPRQQQ